MKTSVSADVRFKPRPPTAKSNQFQIASMGNSSVNRSMKKNLPWVVSRRASIVGSELKALTISKRLSGSTDPSSRRYVTLL